MDDEVLILEVREVVKSLSREGIGALEFRCTAPFQTPDLLKTSSAPLWIGAEDTVVEFGHPLSESICLGLVTRNGALIADGRVTVVGGELKELSPGRHSIAFIVVASAGAEEEQTRWLVSGKMSVWDGLVGCMTKVMSGKIWIRIGSDALKRGLSLGAMGHYLLSELKKEDGQVAAAEVVIVVSGKEHVNRFQPIADRCAERNRLRYVEAVKKMSDCDNPLDCEVCPETVACQIFKDAVVLAGEAGRSS